MSTTAAMWANERRAEVIADEMIREYGPAGESIDYRRALVLAAARALNSEDARRDRESGEAARREMAMYRREARMETAHALREALAKHGDRNPDPDGGSLAQLTIAARALLAVIGEDV